MRVGSGAEPRPKTYLVPSRAVRELLVANILTILKCTFYSRTIVRRPRGGANRLAPPLNPPLAVVDIGLYAAYCLLYPVNTHCMFPYFRLQAAKTELNFSCHIMTHT